MLYNVVINHDFHVLKDGVWSPFPSLLTQLQLTLLSLSPLLTKGLYSCYSRLLVVLAFNTLERGYMVVHLIDKSSQKSFYLFQMCVFMKSKKHFASYTFRHILNFSLITLHDHSNRISGLHKESSFFLIKIGSKESTF